MIAFHLQIKQQTRDILYRSIYRAWLFFKKTYRTDVCETHTKDEIEAALTSVCGTVEHFSVLPVEMRRVLVVSAACELP